MSPSHVCKKEPISNTDSGGPWGWEKPPRPPRWFLKPPLPLFIFEDGFQLLVFLWDFSCDETILLGSWCTGAGCKQGRGSCDSTLMKQVLSYSKYWSSWTSSEFSKTISWRFASRRICANEHCIADETVQFHGYWNQDFEIFCFEYGRGPLIALTPWYSLQLLWSFL